MGVDRRRGSGRRLRATRRTRALRGFTLVELLMATAIGVLLLAALAEVGGLATTTYDAVSERERLTRDARFAMEQMVRITRGSRRLLLPSHDRAATNWPENVREETVPASPPIGDSTLATAVLAVTLPADIDLDGDGVPDADNDGDGLFDEDLYNDVTNDGVPGVYEIDDDGDGAVDEGGSWWWNDDEYLFFIDEDDVDGVDDDGDGTIDDDPPADMNADGCPGLCGVDDDGDGTVDEGAAEDDDEDGSTDEDNYEPVVFHLVGSTLVQRTPVPWDENASGTVGGLDFLSHTIAENVTRFRVERLPATAGGSDLVDLTLELTGPRSGERVELNTVVRVGGRL